MSEILKIDSNVYTPQRMKSEGGGIEPTLQSKEVTIAQNGTTTIKPDTGYDGLEEVEITTNVPQLDTSDATAVAGDIEQGKTAYVNGVKLTGTKTGSQVVLPDGIRFQEAQCSDFSWLKSCDFSNLTTMKNMFYYCNQASSFPLFDTSNVARSDGAFQNCTQLISANSYDLTNNIFVTNMFSGCVSLVDIPLYESPNLQNAKNMITNCDALSNESLNNVLGLLAGTNSYQSTKTLKAVGFSSSQATTATSLSNWQTLQGKGWSSGY